VFQLKRGHRFSNDDLFTAWRAALHMPNAKKLLDLGSGIGSVGLSTLAKMRSHDASLVCLEAQEVSFQLASASIKENGLSGRVAYYRGDLRNSQAVLAQHFEKRRAHAMQPKGGGGSVESVSVVVGDDEGNKKQGQEEEEEEEEEEDELFDLITGSPPYLPAEASLISPVSQRAHCRVELRGSVYDYCAAAALHLK
jgi:tRNA1(Val) A37 N6-methylase TrmN6